MNPTRSANRTVTSRRSVAGSTSWAGGAGGGSAPAATGVPHSPQKRSSAVTGAPHAEQVEASETPHSRQNRLPAGFSVPQATQSTMRVYPDPPLDTLPNHHGRHPPHPVREGLGRSCDRRRSALRRPASGARGDEPTGVRGAAGGRQAGAAARPHGCHRRPQRGHRPGRSGRAVADAACGPRPQLRRIRRPPVPARTSPQRDRARDRAAAGPDPARHDDRLRRLPHVHPRRVRRARVRYRHERGRARAGDADAAPAPAAHDANRLRRRAGTGLHRQGHDPGHDRPDRHRRRRRPCDRVHRRSRPRPLHGGADDGGQHVDRGGRAGGHVRPRRHDLCPRRGPAGRPRRLRRGRRALARAT